MTIRSVCPYCGDTDLGFNPQPTRSYLDGDLFYCRGCGGHGKTEWLVDDDTGEDAS